MSRTDIDPATLAKALRGMAGDGSIEWVYQPIQASVLLDVADALDENAELRKDVKDLEVCYQILSDRLGRDFGWGVQTEVENDKLRELAADMLRAMRRMETSAGMDVLVGSSAWFAPKLHELGIEVD